MKTDEDTRPGRGTTGATIARPCSAAPSTCSGCASTSTWPPGPGSGPPAFATTPGSSMTPAGPWSGSPPIGGRPTCHPFPAFDRFSPSMTPGTACGTGRHRRQRRPGLGGRGGPGPRGGRHPPVGALDVLGLGPLRLPHRRRPARRRGGRVHHRARPRRLPRHRLAAGSPGWCRRWAAASPACSRATPSRRPTGACSAT